MAKQIRFLSNGKKGFTIVELMVAIGVLAVLTVLSYFAAGALLPNYRMNGALRMVKADLYNAKMSAAKKNLEYRVVFSAANYQIQRGNATAGSTAWTTENLRDFSDYAGISVNTGSTGNPVFSPRGTASPVTITLKDDDGASNTISVSLAGKVKVN